MSDNLPEIKVMPSVSDLPTLAKRINEEHAAVTLAITEGLQHAMTAGDLLLEAKAKVKHGQWLPWLRENCAISERTAQLYMRVARERPMLEMKSATVADLTLRGAADELATPVDNRLSGAVSNASWVPPDGFMHVAEERVGNGIDEVYVMPSMHEGYYFVVHLFTQDAGDAFVSTLRKPIRWNYIAAVLEMWGCTERRNWDIEALECRPQAENIFLAGA